MHDLKLGSLLEMSVHEVYPVQETLGVIYERTNSNNKTEQNNKGMHIYIIV